MFEANILAGSQKLWSEIGETVFSLETKAFGDKSFTSEYLREDFSNSRNILVTLKDKSVDKIIGFVYAKPIDEAESGRENEKGETAYIWDIVMDEPYRGKRLTSLLMNKLEEELRIRGYQYFEVCAVMANGYAGSISKNYQERIITSHPVDSIWGKQLFFRVKL